MRTTGGREEVLEELELGDGKFTLRQANRQTMLPTETKNFTKGFT